MKKQLIILVLSVMLLPAFGQELPAGFKEKVQEDYNHYSEEVIEDELQMTFDQYYVSRKAQFIDRQNFLSFVANKELSNVCDNGTFEEGQIIPTDWNYSWGGGALGSYSALGEQNTLANTGSFTSTGDHSTEIHHSIVTPGPDLTLPTMLNQVWDTNPNGNSFSLRLGNKGVGKGYESICKVITVEPGQVLNFTYAMVLQNPANAHSPGEIPFFALNLIDANDITINYNHLVDLGNGLNFIESDNPLLEPALIPGTNQARMKNWTCATVDLSTIAGTNIIVEFFNRDCLAGGHYGYSYIDNICLENCTGGNEGEIELDLEVEGFCQIPGQICVNYTLPSGGVGTPSVDLELNLIQDGMIQNTLVSPNLTSDGTYCFILDNSNTTGLDLTLGYDIQVIGTPYSGSTPLGIKYIGSATEGSKPGQNNDCIIDTPPPTCCPGTNKIQNGDFENGNNNFSSSYMYQGNAASNSLLPGQYGIFNGDEANTISNWQIQDPSTCDNTSGNFLLVNGENGGGDMPPELDNSILPQKLVWQQTVNVPATNNSKTYKLCFQAKNLNQCINDITPTLIVGVDPGGNQSTQLIDVPVGSCDWFDFETDIVIPSNGLGVLFVSISLDQSEFGDGNDVAIDNISLIELDECPDGSALFNLETIVFPGNSTFFNVIATAIVNSTCDQNYWTVCEADPATFDPVSGTEPDCFPGTTGNPGWTTYTTDFRGYDGTSVPNGTLDPGMFEYGKLYKVTRYVYSECNELTSWWTAVIPQERNNIIQVFTQDQLQQNPGIILEYLDSE